MKTIAVKKIKNGRVASAARFLFASGRSYKPHSVQRNCFRLCSHLSGRCVTAPLDAAYPELAFPTVGEGTCGNEPFPIVHRRIRSCLALLPAGVTWPRALLHAPVVSYTTVSPSLPSPLRPSPSGRGDGDEGELFVSVALFRQVRASRRLSRPGCYPTPCSMECGLSSTPSTRSRDCPTNLRRLHHTRPGRRSQPGGRDSARRGWEGPPWEEENALRKHQGIGIKVCCENRQKDIKIGGNPPSLRSRCEPSAREIHHRPDR